MARCRIRHPAAGPARARSRRCAPARRVDGVFACTRKERLLARSGAPYLAVELRDRSGALPARVFRDADLHGGRFERGELVRVSRPRRALPRADPDRARPHRARRRGRGSTRPTFLPVAYRDLDELDGFLEHLAREVADPGYRRLLDALLDDARAARASCAARACTRAGHHAYLGGLLEHTVAVATLAQELALGHPRLNSDLLICAAIVHDIGKTREFTYGATIERSEEGRLLGHVQIGLRILRERGARLLDERRLLALEHCVLCHHGPDAAPSGRFAERRGARAVPPQRARRAPSRARSSTAWPAGRSAAALIGCRWFESGPARPDVAELAMPRLTALWPHERAAKAVIHHSAHGVVAKLRRQPLRSATLLGAGLSRAACSADRGSLGAAPPLPRPSDRAQRRGAGGRRRRGRALTGASPRRPMHRSS